MLSSLSALGRSASLLAVAALLALPASADEPRPGSVLVFPSHVSSPSRMTCIAVTNTHPTKSVNAVYRYVTSTLETTAPSQSQDCSEIWRGELLTPDED